MEAGRQCRVDSQNTTINRVTPQSRPTARRPGRSPVGEALHLLGDRWTLLILRDAFLTGHRRYGQWSDELPISDAVLTRRLQDLVDTGVFERSRYDRRPPRYEYRLTPRGLALWRILVALWEWESRWVPGSAEAQLSLVHRVCAAVTRPVLICGVCGEQVSLGDVATNVGRPGREWLRSPDRVRRRSITKTEDPDAPVFRRETIDILGDRWSSTLIGLAFLGVRRFSDFQQSVAVSPTLLSGRLRNLTSLGVLESVPVVEGGRRTEYRLTAKGLAFFPAVLLVLDWADTWLADGKERSVEVTHLACGNVMRPALGCASCGIELERPAVGWQGAGAHRP